MSQIPLSAYPGSGSKSIRFYLKVPDAVRRFGGIPPIIGMFNNREFKGPIRMCFGMKNSEQRFRKLYNIAYFQ
jgi:hypothetical protein